LEDINGDGLLDYVRLDAPGGGGGIQAYKNKMLGFAHWANAQGVWQGTNQTDLARTRVETTAMTTNHQFITAGEREAWARRFDFDHDGRVDAYIDPPDAQSLGPVFFNTGGVMAQKGVHPPANHDAAIRQHATTYPSPLPGRSVWESKSDFTDLDGDGLPEGVSWNGTTMQRSLPPVNGMPPRLLVAVSNGRGLTTTIRYAALSDSTVVNNDPDNGTASPRTQWVVKSVSTEDDFESTGPTDPTTTYFYNDPWYGPDDEQRYSFRGFQEITATGPSGSKTVERYSFTPDWSGRLDKTLVKDENGDVHTIAETTWEARSLFAGALTTYHATIARSWACNNGATETSCKATPAGFTRSDITWTALASTTSTGGPAQLYVETAKTSQDSEAYDDGDRRSTTTFELHSDATSYRLRDKVLESWVRTSSGDQRFRHTKKDWDSTHSKLEYETVTLNATDGATTKRDYDATGLVTGVTKPKQYAGSATKTITEYDQRKLFPIKTTNELGHQSERDYEYGTGAVLEERGPNYRNCASTQGCPSIANLPERDGKKTTIDGLGRPLELAITSMYPGYPQVYAWSTIEKFVYVDTPTASPTNVTHQQLIAFDDTRWTTERTDLDGHGRPIKTVESVNGTAPVDAVTTYDYDIEGKLVAVSVPDPTQNSTAQVTFTYTFDSLGRPTAIRRPDAVAAADRSGIDVSYNGLVEVRAEKVPV
jgi:hypothetical protein